jgi:hypothetical protein
MESSSSSSMPPPANVSEWYRPGFICTPECARKTQDRILAQNELESDLAEESAGKIKPVQRSEFSLGIVRAIVELSRPFFFNEAKMALSINCTLARYYLIYWVHNIKRFLNEAQISPEELKVFIDGIDKEREMALKALSVLKKNSANPPALAQWYQDVRESFRKYVPWIIKLSSGQSNSIAVSEKLVQISSCTRVARSVPRKIVIPGGLTPIKIPSN